MTKDQKNEVSVDHSPRHCGDRRLTMLKQGEKEFSIQPIKESVDPKFGAFGAHPGPAIPKEMPKEEGTKEERKAKMEALNKK